MQPKNLSAKSKILIFLKVTRSEVEKIKSEISEIVEILMAPKDRSVEDATTIIRTEAEESVGDDVSAAVEAVNNEECKITKNLRENGKDK